MRLRSYYKKHLRSLFISKFVYVCFSEIINLRFGFLQVGFKKDKLNFGLAFMFLFLITCLHPRHNMKFNVMRGKKKLGFGALNVKLRNFFFFSFLEKMNILYLPNFENWAGVLKNLELSARFSSFKFLKFEDFSIFPELDFLLNFNFANLQSISQK